MQYILMLWQITSLATKAPMDSVCPAEIYRMAVASSCLLKCACSWEARLTHLMAWNFVDFIPSTAGKECPTRQCIVCCKGRSSSGNKVRKVTCFWRKECCVRLCLVPCLRSIIRKQCSNHLQPLFENFVFSHLQVFLNKYLLQNVPVASSGCNRTEPLSITLTFLVNIHVLVVLYFQREVVNWLPLCYILNLQETCYPKEQFKKKCHFLNAFLNFLLALKGLKR